MGPTQAALGRPLALALALGACACQDEPSPAPPGTPAAAGGAASAASGAGVDLVRMAFESGAAAPGVLEGLVLYAGVAPARVAINTAAEEGCGFDPNEPALTETWVVADGRLANVFVWLENPPPPSSTGDGQARPVGEPASTGAEPAFTGAEPALTGAEPALGPVVMRQQACVYRPHAVGLRVGQALLVTNEDRARHNVRAIPRRNPDFNASQDGGAPALELRFATPEVAIALVCDLHPWMKAWVGVFDHPWFAVTGVDGSFAWPELPPGEYRVRAWHEALGKLVGTAVVAPDAGARLCLVYPPRD
jgi:plastocyanin